MAQFNSAPCSKHVRCTSLFAAKASVSCGDLRKYQILGNVYVNSRSGCYHHKEHVFDVVVCDAGGESDLYSLQTSFAASTSRSLA